MDIEAIKAKYLVNDDFVSKMKNMRGHEQARRGFSYSKEGESRVNLDNYIRIANSDLGGLSGPVQIYAKAGAGRGVPTFGLNWKAMGTVSVPEAQLFIKKLQQAIKVIQNAPKVSLR
jgi:hypothetical protein